MTKHHQKSKENPRKTYEETSQKNHQEFAKHISPKGQTNLILETLESGQRHTPKNTLNKSPNCRKTIETKYLKPIKSFKNIVFVFKHEINQSPRKNGGKKKKKPQDTRPRAFPLLRAPPWLGSLVQRAMPAVSDEVISPTSVRRRCVRRRRR